MANTQTSVPLFVANAVLTAAQQNISAATGVPVFATTVTRDAAFGGSNKALAEGQLCYLESTNVVQYYDGSAWATVGPSASNGLTYITGTTFSAVAAVSLPASTFSATYKNYRIMFVSTLLSSENSITLRMRVSSADNTTSNYQYTVNGTDSSGTTQGNNATGQAQSNVMYGLTTGVSMSMDIYNPQATELTRWTLIGMGKGVGSSNPASVMGGGVFNATTSFDAVSFNCGSNMTGRYSVYGYTD